MVEDPVKELLMAIETRLKNALAADTVGRVWIVPMLDQPPQGSRFPCVGIKDGETAVLHQPSNQMIETEQVEIAIWDEYYRNESGPLVGGVGKAGILDLTDKARKALRHDDLSTDGYSNAKQQITTAIDIRVASSKPMPYLGDKQPTRFLQQVILTMEYQVITEDVTAL